MLFDFLFVLLVLGAISSRTLGWNVETSCPMTSRPTFQPHPLSCSLYLFCTGDSSSPFLQRCPRGQAFDTNTGQCTDSSEAKCFNNLSPSWIPTAQVTYEGANSNNLPCSKSDYIRYAAHPTNCSRFYECSMGKVVEMDCPRGLSFIPHLELCGTSPQTCGVKPISVSNRSNRDCLEIVPPKCPTVSIGYSLRLPHQDCDSFYLCMNGVPIKVRCPPGLHFNPLIQECDLPARSKCTNCPSIDGPGQAGEDEELNQCPKDYGFQLSLRHPQHCDRFYSCNSGNPIQRQCPLGLLFNPVTQTCDWPTSVNCHNDNLDGPGDINDGMDHCHTYENCNHGSLLPNPSDCSSFYQCVWGQPVLMKCPSDLYFNPKLQVCDWPWNVDCEDDSSSSSSDSSSSSSSEGDDSDENDTESPDPDSGLEEMSSETDNENQEEVIPVGVPLKTKEMMIPIKCPFIGRNHECEMPKCPPYNYGYVVEFYNPFNCSEFFKCNWGEAIKFSCPSGLHYNRRLQVCDYPELAECSTCDEKEPHSRERNTLDVHREVLPQKLSTPCKAGVSSLPDPVACGSFYTCEDGELAKKSCPRGLHYNPVRKVCDFPRQALCGLYQESQSSSCPELNSSICSLGREDIFLNPKDCSSYYQCENGNLALKQCPKGKEFNAVMKLCDQPQKAMCRQCVEDGEKRAECSSSLYGQSVILSDPKSCNAYYKCEWGVIVPHKCPEGLHFNNILGVCDLPERSRCKE